MWRGTAIPGLVLLALLWAPGPASAAAAYVVRAGDTLWRIAHHLGVRPADLAAANHLALTDTIHPGLRLVVPGSVPRPARTSAPPPPPPAPERAVEASGPATPVPRAPTRASVSGAAVRIATGLLGRPYEWSGTGGRGFDCSGLVEHVFASLGRPLPHSSFAQYAAGTGVAWGDLAPGDLVFFTTYSPGASHVGIYIGGSRFIHASYSRGVTVSSLDDAYFRARFIGGRRL